MKLKTDKRKIYRIRNKLKKVSASDRYRLSIKRSLKNISAQIIDDQNKKTLMSTSSTQKDIKSLKLKNKSELSIKVAEKLAKAAKDKKISKFLRLFASFLLFALASQDNNKKIKTKIKIPVNIIFI